MQACHKQMCIKKKKPKNLHTEHAVDTILNLSSPETKGKNIFRVLLSTFCAQIA